MYFIIAFRQTGVIQGSAQNACKNGENKPKVLDFDHNNNRDGSLRDETIKWSAAANFAENWDYEETDSYQVTSMFINNREQILHSLLDE